jgi:HPt (histidine-containing phosphotransfer) domain-containing protein
MEPGNQEACEPIKGRRKGYMFSSLIDFAELLGRVENDRELMRELLLIFKEEFPRHHQGLHDAVESLDAKRVASEAHTLKGMFSNLAAREAAGSAAHLEQLGRRGETSKFVEGLAAFDRLAKELLQQVDSVAEMPR